MEDKYLEAVSVCPVCSSGNHTKFIATPALMHHTEDTFSFSCCGQCNAAFLNPRVTTDHLKTYYPDYYLPYRGAAAWGKYRGFVDRSQQKMDKKRLKTCKKFGSKNTGPIKLLDVGCGNPTFLQTLSQNTDWQLTGIDFTDEGWKNSGNLSFKLITGDVQAMELAEKFDLVTMWHYLEHDYNPNKTLASLRKHLKTGGKVIIEVPDYLSLTAKWQQAHWEGWHTPRHTLLYTKSAFERLAASNGYKLLKHYRYGTLDAFTLWWMGTMEKKKANWAGSMETEFFPLVWKKVYTAPLFMLEKWLPLGIQTVVLEAV